MGRDLHYTILKFVEKRLDDHSAVAGWERIDCDEYIAYKIDRTRYGDTVTVVLSDAYLFTEFDFVNRPDLASEYILVARPEAGHNISRAITNTAKIGVGKLGEMMGALNSEQMWSYTPPSDEELRKRRERRR
jgi:hypothetical protein